MATGTPTTFHFSISGDFPNRRVVLDLLREEIIGSSISTALNSLGKSGDDCAVTFADVLSTANETTLDGIVAAHTGKLVIFEFRGALTVVPSEALIVGLLTFDVLGGIAMQPAALEPLSSDQVIRFWGEVKSLGTGGEIQVVENASGTDTIIATFSIPDTSSAYQAVTFDSTVSVQAGLNTYRVEGRLNGATLAAVRFASLGIFRRVVFLS